MTEGASTAEATAHIAARDGCACPPWIVRCAHWGGRILIFIDNEAVPTRYAHCSNPSHDLTYSGQPYGVGSILKWVTIPGCGCLGWPSASLQQFYSGRGPAAAVAEFYRQEAKLLGRSDD